MAMSSTLTALRSKLGLSGLSVLWKLLAIVFALLDLKNLPFAWHIRLTKGLFTQRRTSRIRLASKSGAAALFQPMIISSRSGILECDYNIHKSNSTYFSDFDIGRLELLVNLFTPGTERTRKELAKEGSESFGIMLGGVSCNFRKEIKPYESFEVWTRVLCWDRKWVYIIGHFVKKGAVTPKSYTLQPWRNVVVKKDGSAVSSGYAVNGNDVKAAPHPAIFASCISKYVFKKGRLTIPPERVLRNSELLPPKPADHEIPPVSITPNPEATSFDVTAASMAEKLTADNAGEVMAASLTAKAGSDFWDWERVEKERQRGMKIATLYNGLEALNDEFTADERPVLGCY